MSRTNLKILEDITTSIPGAIYQFLVASDGCWSFQYISKNIEDLYEVTQEDVCRNADVMTRCILAEDRPDHRRSVEVAVRDFTPWHHQHRILTKTGAIKRIHATALPKKIDGGGTLWSGVLTDITALTELRRIGSTVNNPVHQQHVQEISQAETKIRVQYHPLAHLVSKSPDTDIISEIIEEFGKRSAVFESPVQQLSPPNRQLWNLDNTRSQIITPGNVAIPLTAQQDIVLNLLCKRQGKSISRSELLDALGHTDDECGNQCLETLISRLRAKVRSADPQSELPLRSRQGSGYAFLGEVQ